MKRLKFLFVSLLSMLLVTSCSHDISGYGIEQQEKDYQTAFQTEFGQIATNHNWGFDFTSSTRALTRGHDVNGNLWYQSWDRPTNVTEAEAAKVLEEFSKKRENTVNSQSLPYENYWVQQVHTGTVGYNDGNGNSIGVASAKMNHLLAYNFVSGAYEHINNFNNGNNTTVYTDDVTKEKFIGTTLMKDMGKGDNAKQFGYHNSTDSKDHFEYIVLQIDGAYYVGFDFYATHPDGQEANKNMDVDRDWVFNDWIVKISPAIPVENTVVPGEPPHPADYYDGAVRIICEDLIVNINGTHVDSSDWDFNDVVFDVVTTWIAEENANKTIITVKAAGGTMPLTVDGQEVHNLLGVSTGTMVNTGLVSAPEKSFYASRVYWSHEYKDIAVLVRNGNAVYELKALQGIAPQKICVGTDYEWCAERQNIKTKYTSFVDYVKNNGSNSWY